MSKTALFYSNNSLFDMLNQCGHRLARSLFYKWKNMTAISCERKFTTASGKFWFYTYIMDIKSGFFCRSPTFNSTHAKTKPHLSSIYTISHLHIHSMILQPHVTITTFRTIYVFT